MMRLMPRIVEATISPHLATNTSDDDGKVPYRQMSLQNNTSSSSRQRIGLNEQV